MSNRGGHWNHLPLGGFFVGMFTLTLEMQKAEEAN